MFLCFKEQLAQEKHLYILRELKRSGTTRKLNKKLVNFDQFNDLVELKKYRKLEKQYKK